MKIEYLADASLIRLFDFDPESALRLKTIFEALAAGEHNEIILTDEPEVTPLNDCHLTLRLAAHDDGVSPKPSPPHFEWRLSPDGWATAAQMAEPFCYPPTHASERSQWLGAIRPTRILLSPTGKW